MTDAYSGRDSRRTNAPAGFFRRELVRATKANELKLSGSPIQYFTDVDYQNADDRVTGSYKMGVASLYNHTTTTWIDAGAASPAARVTAVSTDGYTITLSSGVAVGDLIEVYYYATGTGWRDAEPPAQAGDPLPPEAWDALPQKLNDCPPLDWENNSPAMVYDISMAREVGVTPLRSATTKLVQYSPVQLGTWQTTNLPFYVTSIFFGFDGVGHVLGHLSALDIFIDNNQFECGGQYLEGLLTPANPGVAGYDQSFFVNLGLVECREDFRVDVTLGPLGADTTAWETNVAGWHS